MPKKPSSNGDYQLNVWISAEADAYLTACYEQDGRHRKEIIETLIRREMAVLAGEQVERQSLPVIQGSIDTTMRKYLAQLRSDLREDMQLEIVEAMKTTTRSTENRLASLIVRAVRDSGLLRRVLYALIAKLLGPEFAKEAYEDARAKVGQELAARSAVKKEVQ